MGSVQKEQICFLIIYPAPHYNTWVAFSWFIYIYIHTQGHVYVLVARQRYLICEQLYFLTVSGDESDRLVAKRFAADK